MYFIHILYFWTEWRRKKIDETDRNMHNIHTRVRGNIYYYNSEFMISVARKRFRRDDRWLEILYSLMFSVLDEKKLVNHKHACIA